ncbi:MAG: hypothetical protein J6B08_03090 [Ruminiclostridium sp.]|nr:hypothetical protein [Ruminiclostridium sp.]
MKPTITIESLRNPLGEFLLVNVVNGKGVIGICDTTRAFNTSRRTFYVGSESIINVFSSSDDDSANRQIWQCSSIDKCKNILGNKLKSAVEEFFYEGASLAKAVQPVLELLTDGLYVVHSGTAFPTDGAGNFFWNAYLIKHELNGSAPYNPAICYSKIYEPAFLVPTRNFSSYSEKNTAAAAARMKRGRRLGGIAYHLTGMFSALLSGHDNAAACLTKGEEFPCIIIEPMKDVLYLHDEITDTDRIMALSSPYVKLPLENISRSMIENFLLNRRVSVPEFHEEIRAKADKNLPLKGAARNLSAAIEQNLEKLPDAEMLSSAFAITELTDEHLELLLAGETKINDMYIISSNYYESIVYACNFLQYKDRQRFISFTTTILSTPSLSATYRYVAERLRFEMDAKVNETFKAIVASEDPIYIPIKELAQKYLVRYHEYVETSVNKFIGADEYEDEEFVSAMERAASGVGSGVQSSVDALVRLRDGTPVTVETSDGEYSSMALKKKLSEAPPPPKGSGDN